MGSLVAVLQNDATLLRCQVARLSRHVALRDPDRVPDGYGFGYYIGTEVLLAKRPTGATSSLSLAQLTGEVDGEALVAHARNATVGNHKDENTHPFRFRRWLFAHDGTIDSFGEVRGAIREAVPDFLRRQIQGDTDSEHAFALFLATLRAEGSLDDLDVDAASVGRALARTVRAIDELSRRASVQRPSTMNFVATNGRVLAVTRRGRPLFYTLLEGILPCARHELDANARDTDPQVARHRRVKAVCFASHLLAPNGFIEVPEASVVAVDRSLQVRVSALAGY